jgi:hypothetical protein
MAAGILGQHMREIHHPARHPRQAAARGGNSHGFSHSESTITLRKTDMEHLIATIAESLVAESLAPAQIHGGPASPYAGPLAALALHHPVALLQQALALAILAFLLLLDVGAFFIGHDNLPASVARITIASPALPSISPHKRFKRSPWLPVES